MVRFDKLAPTEKGYPFVDAVAADTYKNGKFGEVADGTFTAGEGFKAIMQVEKGNDMHTDNFVVNKGEHARIADLTKADGQIVNITADQLPDSYSVSDKLVANTTGDLVVNASATNNYLEVLEVTRYGVKAVVTATAATN